MQTIKKRQAEIFFIVFGILILAVGTTSVSTRDQLVEAKGDIRDKNIVRTGTPGDGKTTLEFYIGEHKYVVTYLAHFLRENIQADCRQVVWDGSHNIVVAGMKGVLSH